MKKRELFIAVLVIAVLVCALSLALTACDPTDKTSGHEHSYQEVAALDATCTTPGNRLYYTCSGCGKFFDERHVEADSAEQFVIPMLGHDLSDYHEYQDPTCLTYGSVEYWHCVRCNTDFADAYGEEKFEGDKRIDKLPHNMQPHQLQDSDCLHTGTRAYYECSLCGNKFEDEDGDVQLDDSELEIAKKSHHMSKTNGTPATCTEEGTETYWYCDLCETRYLDEEGTEIVTGGVIISPLGHNYHFEEGQNETCESDGTREHFHCERCNKNFESNDNPYSTDYMSDDELVIEGGHILREGYSYDADCMNEGCKPHYFCDRCEKYFKDSAGTDEYGEFEYVIPAKGHTLEQRGGKEATCTEDGEAIYYYCTACESKFWTNDPSPSNFNFVQEDIDLKIHKLGHDPKPWETSIAATCSTLGEDVRKCVRCGEVQEERVVNMIPHTWDDQNKCSVCQAVKPYEEKDGFIYFGEYPQTRIEQDDIIATLSQMSGDRPVPSMAGTWKKYDYYLVESVGEYMWYQDIEFDGAKYRGVYFTHYRTYFVGSSSYDDDETGALTKQKENGYEVNELYWFKWEPIEWRVLEKDDETKEAFLMSNVILDSQQYYNKAVGSTRTIDGRTVYENNYKESDIRTWLNETFFDWAFDENSKSTINITEVDNSERSLQIADSNFTKFTCASTLDKVFLLSRFDAISHQYGFLTGDRYNEARMLKPTEYAKSQGVYIFSDASDPHYVGYSYWWLRSPSDDDQQAMYVSSSGSIMGGEGTYGRDVNYTYSGVVPAVKIRL